MTIDCSNTTSSPPQTASSISLSEQQRDRFTHSDVMRSSASLVGYTPSPQTQTATRPHSSTSNNKHFYPPPVQTSNLMSNMAAFRNYAPLQQDSASSSQSSYRSVASSGDAGSAASLPTSSNNHSQSTLDTNVTTPISPQSASDYTRFKEEDTTADWHAHRSGVTPTATKTQGRLRTPEDQTDGGRTRRHGLTSPMSVTTPRNGTKRSASGAVKSPTYLVMGSPAEMALANRGRGDSVSSSSSKAGEAAAQLKARLSYAMAKVQHGWEHRSMAEVEQLAAGLSPKHSIAAPRAGQRGPISPRAAIAAARPRSSGLSDGTALLNMRGHASQYEPSTHYRAGPTHDTSMSPPSKRRSGNFQSFPLYKPAALAPAPEINGLSRHRKINSNSSAPLRPSAITVSASPPGHASHLPSTPKSHRPATLRTQTQTAQAEQDAMDALLLMGSPNNGGRFPDSYRHGSQQSSAQASPRNATFARSAGPRQALQYRSDSSESILSRDSHSPITSIAAGDRGVLLAQIEAES